MRSLESKREFIVTVKPLGKISVATAGGRVAASSTPVMVCRVHFQAVTGETGKVYIGDSTLNLATSAGVIHMFWPTGAGGGQPQDLDIVDHAGSGNAIDLSTLSIGAQIAGEGCLVTYFQR